MEEEKEIVKDVELGTLYDINKNLVEQTKSLSRYALNNRKDIIYNFIKTCGSRYYMLLSNENKDYTLFYISNKEDENKIHETINILVDECLINRGDVKGLDLTKNKDAIEIWISINGDSFVYYFFPYDNAVIEI